MPQKTVDLQPEKERAWLQAAVSDFSCDALACLPNQDMADLSFSAVDIDRLSTMPLSAIEVGVFVDHVPRLSGGRSEVADQLPYDLSKHEQVSQCQFYRVHHADSIALESVSSSTRLDGPPG